MSARSFFQLLILAAVLLTVLTGPLSVACGTDGPWVILFAETTEDVEEDDDRDDLFVRDAELTVEATLPIATCTVGSTDTEIPVVCGPPNERGPPVV